MRLPVRLPHSLVCFPTVGGERRMADRAWATGQGTVNGKQKCVIAMGPDPRRAAPSSVQGLSSPP
jgi:hypothetical protein